MGYIKNGIENSYAINGFFIIGVLYPAHLKEEYKDWTYYLLLAMPKNKLKK